LSGRVLHQRDATVRRVLDGLTSAALVVLGVRLASEQE
jgi:hypothetical protein